MERWAATIVVLACALAMITLSLSVRADRPDWQQPMTTASIAWLLVTVVIMGLGFFAALLVPR